MPNQQTRITIIGAGLAGSEAAWQVAKHGLNAHVYEMRPTRMTEAHTTSKFGELVCSNSLGSDSPNTASRLLKEEMELLGSFILRMARESAVPAGNSLAVDREIFASKITEELSSISQLTIHREELTEIPDGIVIVATGPLTSAAFSQNLKQWLGNDTLYFYDAISPIVSADSLDHTKMFFASRYGKGGADFLNIPLTKSQYEEFVSDLTSADSVPLREFEQEKYFEACLPIEVLAKRGVLTLAYGPMKPVGLVDPVTGRIPFAVVQLRTENRFRTAYNLVGFQTKIKYGDQARIFRKLPGLQKAEFLRLGGIHRNTYIDSPSLLTPSLQLRKFPRIFVAGQLVGTEGYLESSATGLIAGQNAVRFEQGNKPMPLPTQTMLGALLATITDSEKSNFQPMNANMGVLPPLEHPPRSKDKRHEELVHRAVSEMKRWCVTSPCA